MKTLGRIRTNLLSAVAVVAMACVVTVTLAGCTPAQKLTTLQIVTAVDAKIPAITAAADTVAATIAVLDPSDAVLIDTCDVGFDSAAKTLKSLLDAYIANPDATVLQQIQAMVNALEGDVNTALVNAAHIKNANSQQLAVAGLKALLGAISVAFALMASTETLPQLRELQRTGTIQIAVIRRNVDEPKLQQELAGDGVDLDAMLAKAELLGF